MSIVNDGIAFADLHTHTLRRLRKLCRIYPFVVWRNFDQSKNVSHLLELVLRIKSSQGIRNDQHIELNKIEITLNIRFYVNDNKNKATNQLDIFSIIIHFRNIQRCWCCCCMKAQYNNNKIKWEREEKERERKRTKKLNQRFSVFISILFASTYFSIRIDSFPVLRQLPINSWLFTEKWISAKRFSYQSSSEFYCYYCSHFKKSQVMPECLKMSESSIIRLVICMYFIRVISFLIFILLFLFCHSWLYVCLLVICKLYYIRCSHIYKSTQGKRHLIYLS